MQNEHILAALAPHQREALELGRSINHEGETYTAESFGLTPGANAGVALDAATEKAQLSRRIEQLETALSAAETENVDLKAQLSAKGKPGRPPKDKSEGETPEEPPTEESK